MAHNVINLDDEAELYGEYDDWLEFPAAKRAKHSDDDGADEEEGGGRNGVEHPYPGGREFALGAHQPRHIRKAVARIYTNIVHAGIDNKISHQQILDSVVQYCLRNPHIHDISVIVQHCTAVLIARLNEEEKKKEEEEEKEEEAAAADWRNVMRRESAAAAPVHMVPHEKEEDDPKKSEKAEKQKQSVRAEEGGEGGEGEGGVAAIGGAGRDGEAGSFINAQPGGTAGVGEDGVTGPGGVIHSNINICNLQGDAAPSAVLAGSGGGEQADGRKRRRIEGGDMGRERAYLIDLLDDDDDEVEDGGGSAAGTGPTAGGTIGSAILVGQESRNSDAAAGARAVRREALRRKRQQQQLQYIGQRHNPVLDPVVSVLSIFPNASRAFVVRKLAEYGIAATQPPGGAPLQGGHEGEEAGQQSATQQVVATVVSWMAENGYERDAPILAAAGGDAGADVKCVRWNGSALMAADSLKPGTPQPPSRNFLSSSWATSQAYHRCAMEELQNNFPFLRMPSLNALFKAFNFHYTPTLRAIEKAVGILARGVGPAESSKLRELSAAELKTLRDNRLRICVTIPPGIPATTHSGKTKSESPVKDNNSKVYLTVKLSNLRKTPTRVPEAQMDALFAEELAYLRLVKAEEQEAQDKELAEKVNVEIALEEGCLHSCGCCFDDVAFESLVQCSEGHLFCKECLQRYVETKLFGESLTNIKCMNTSGTAGSFQSSSSSSSSSSAAAGESAVAGHGGRQKVDAGCPGIFTDYMLQAALSETVYKKFIEASLLDVMKTAKIEGLVTCYECQLPTELDTDAGNVLHCPRCAKTTCRLCGEESHVPLKCSEVEKKGETNCRLSVEEAMTEARIRTCPGCKTRFYKTDGCNKMLCSCKKLICYVCREDISKLGYMHFCQKPHCDHTSCNKCKLFTNSLEDDRQAMREAGLKTIRQLQLSSSSSSSSSSSAAAGAGVTAVAGVGGSGIGNEGAKLDAAKVYALLEEAPSEEQARARRAHQENYDGRLAEHYAARAAALAAADGGGDGGGGRGGREGRDEAAALRDFDAPMRPLHQQHQQRWRGGVGGAAAAGAGAVALAPAHPQPPVPAPVPALGAMPGFRGAESRT